MNGKYSPFVAFLPIYGSYTKTEKLTVLQPLVNTIALSQWQTAINAAPNMIKETDVAVIMNGSLTSVWPLDAPNENDASLKIRFNVPTGVYNIALRCITPSANCDSCFVQLDNFPGKLWTTGLGETKLLYTEQTVYLFENQSFESGEHTLKLIYREPMAFIEVILTEKTNLFPVIKIPIIDVVLNPNTVYGRQMFTTTYGPLEKMYPTTFAPMKPILRFPPQTLLPTVDTVSGMSHGNGKYQIKTSSGNSNWSSTYKLFDGNKLYGSKGSGLNTPSTNYAAINKGYYTGTTITTDTTGKTYKGEWVQIALPVKIFLYQLYIYRLWTGGQPYDFVLLGSNDENIWNVLLEQNSANYTQIESNPDVFRLIVNVNAPVAYNFYRIVILRVGVAWSDGSYYGGDYFNMGEFEIFGYI